MEKIMPVKLENRFYKGEKDQYEALAWRQKGVVCGVDEVGRGCFAGPVVAVAAILPPNARIDGLKDSKLLTEYQRQSVYNEIAKSCLWGVGMADNYQIDNYNIRQATLRAMWQALRHVISICPKKIVSILTDDMPIVSSQFSHIETISAPKGESWSLSIAAASIIAKVKRDQLMAEYAKIYPGFGFEGHKGYGTAEHQEYLAKFGPTPIHRQTFLKKFNQRAGDQQVGLF